MDRTGLGQKIRSLRKAAGLTQRTLCSESGVAYATLQDIEAGRGNPTLATLASLAQRLGTTVDALTGESKHALRRVANAQVEARQRLEREILDRIFADPIKRQYLLSVIFEDPSYVSPEAIEAALQEQQSQS